MKYIKNVNCKNRMWLKLGWLAACASIVLVILLIKHYFPNMPVDGNYDTTDMSVDEYHDTEDMLSDENHDTTDGRFVSIHFDPMDTQRLQCAILRIDEITDESVRLGSVTGKEDYIKVRCSIIYSCYRDSFVADLSKLNEIYIVSETTKGLAANDVIFIQVEKRNLNGNYYYCPITNNGQAEYIPIVDDHIVLKGDELYTESFVTLFEINQRICELKEYYERVGEESDYRNALPQEEFRDNMTRNALIDYLSAWENAVNIREEEQRRIREEVDQMWKLL